MSWLERMERITPRTPEDLDADLAGLDPRARPLGQVRQQSAARFPLPFDFAQETTITVGARVTEDTPDIASLAMRLAALAAEKGAEPIILAHCDYSGLERLGFRTERVAGATEAERAACEAELIAFWNIALVL